MEINVDINKEEIQKQIVDAITKSAIGDEIQAAVTKILKTETGTFGNRKTLVERSVEAALQEMLRFVIGEQLRERKELINSQVASLITDDAIISMSRGMWDFAMDKLNDR